MPDDLKRNMTARQPMPLSPIRHDAIHDYRDQIWDDFHSMSPREGQRLTHKYIWPTFEPTEKNKRLQRQYRLAEESIRARHESPPRDDLPGRFYEIPMQGEPKAVATGPRNSGMIKDLATTNYCRSRNAGQSKALNTDNKQP